MAPQKGLHVHQVDASTFVPNDLESAIGEIEQIKRVKSYPSNASLRCSAYFKELSKNQGTYDALPADRRAALAEATTTALALRTRGCSAYETQLALKRFAADLRRLKRLDHGRLLELQAICSQLHADIARIAPDRDPVRLETAAA